MGAVKGPDSCKERIECMVNQYQLTLLRLCYAYLRDEELAKDAVQETFIKAYRNLNGFRETASDEDLAQPYSDKYMQGSAQNRLVPAR